MKKKTIIFNVVLLMNLLFVGCKKEDITVETISNYVAGLKSEFMYEYLPYSADSAQVMFFIDTIGGGIIPCDQVQLLLADSVISEADSIPIRITCRIPLIDDCILKFVHRCYIDSVYCPMPIAIIVHKGELATPNHSVYEIKIPYKVYITSIHKK